MKLYHGSNQPIEQPDVSRNTGFADLGRGFYLTDDLEVARQRAMSRARKTGADAGTVSTYEFDEDALPWATWNETWPSTPAGKLWRSGDPFGLKFAVSQAGITAWADFIRSCRRGTTTAGDLGEPDVVRAWIATEEVEMICAGFAPADAMAEFIDPSQLVVQYCFRNQNALDHLLSFTGTESVVA